MTHFRFLTERYMKKGPDTSMPSVYEQLVCHALHGRIDKLASLLANRRLCDTYAKNALAVSLKADNLETAQWITKRLIDENCRRFFQQSRVSLRFSPFPVFSPRVLRWNAALSNHCAFTLFQSFHPSKLLRVPPCVASFLVFLRLFVALDHVSMLLEEVPHRRRLCKYKFFRECG